MGRSKKNKDLEEGKILLDEEVVLPLIEKPVYTETSCAELHRKFTQKQLKIQPYFQRNFVWKNDAQTRFIDSLVKGLPIPNLCIVEDSKTEEWIVIDGQQRISTILKFLGDDKWKLKKLDDIDPNISGKKISNVKNDTPSLYKRVENTVIPVTIIRCDFSLQSQKENLFNVFHRLNTGGQKLNHQEIRNCIYGVNFNKLLREIAKSDDWKKVIRETNDNDRLESEEMVLRIFAFIDKLDDYKEPLSKFLNDYMFEKQNISDDELEEKKEMLIFSLSFIKDKIDNLIKDNKLGKTQKEGLLVGVVKNIEELNSKSKVEFQSLFQKFINAEEFKPENLKQGLSKKDNVQPRLRKSISIFEG